MFFALCLGNFFFKLSIMGGRGKRKQLAGLPASHPPIHPSSFIQTKNSSMCFMDLCFLDVGPGSRAFTCARESFSGENSCSSPSALRWWFSFPASHSKANFFFFFGLFSCECHTKQGGKNGCWLTSRNACNIGCYHGKAVSTWLLCCLPTATSLRHVPILTSVFSVHSHFWKWKRDRSSPC